MLADGCEVFWITSILCICYLCLIFNTACISCFIVEFPPWVSVNLMSTLFTHSKLLASFCTSDSYIITTATTIVTVI